MGETGEGLRTFNLADIWEAVADRIGDREAVVCGERRLTFSQLEERANRLAHRLEALGVGRGDHVGVYLENGTEYLEVVLAAFKIRAVPININYRYVAEELRYLFDDADLVSLVFHRSLTPRVAEVAPQLSKLKSFLVVDDGSGEDISVLDAADYDEALEASESGRGFGPRSGDDRYILYTGGTTGRPKGVVWRQEDAFFACIGGGDPLRLKGVVDEPAEILGRVIDFDFVGLPVAPLMHAAAQWTSLSWLYCGAKVVLIPGSLNPAAIWRAVEDEKVGVLVVVGDAVVRPLLDAWDADGPFDVSSLYSIGSGGAPLSPKLKDRLVEIAPKALVVDGFGSSETGAQGSQILEGGKTTGGVTRFERYDESTAVLAEDLEVVEPGSGTVGRVAMCGRIPLGYYNDEEKTNATFVQAHGRRWVLTGDMATVGADGTVELLGRGSVCINTGGEKVYPEEVELALKSHDGVYDSVVVGLPDDRWGEKVAAVVRRVEGAGVDAEGLVAHCRKLVAGYKVPREFVFVDEIQRSPVGKADYRWARQVAASATSS
ncbi:MAG: 3-oxocholest-4-en-26-oate--CoA ligase [Acidimicrobiales bacterium]|nr:MAG: acyl-CoA synthetase [Actinomycetota bacterium]MBV6507845.1 3-oxocholest-4-en-26-oate--CoA ligase [Acidimicrobiales bacterium]RIK05995.1 MAG: hypothetical protein DCC48_08560 [Acidobacteriota bacterium]